MALGGLEGKDESGLESVPTRALLLRANNASRELKAVDAALRDRVGDYLQRKMGASARLMGPGVSIRIDGDNLLLTQVPVSYEGSFTAKGIAFQKCHPHAIVIHVLIPLSELDEGLPVSADYPDDKQVGQIDAVPGDLRRKFGDGAMATVADLADSPLDSSESSSAGLLLALERDRRQVSEGERKLYAAVDDWFRQKFGEPEDGGNWKLGDVDEDGREKRNMKVEGENLVVSFPVMNQAVIGKEGRFDLGYLLSIKKANYRSGRGGKLEVLIPLSELDQLVNQ